MNFRIVVLRMFVLVLAVLWTIGCSGGGGGSSSPAGGGTTTSDGGGGTTSSGGGGTITLSGQVVVTSSQLAAAGFKAGDISRARAASVMFATTADSALPDATVTLYKMKADGTEEVVSGVTATTDANGNYTLDNIPPVQTGTGAATDFYYEVRATSGSLEVSAPAAPTADDTINISPETKIAAAMISDVASVPSVTAADVLPTAKAIELLRDAVFADIGNMSSFTLPSMAAGSDTQVGIAATAVSANSGNAEKLMRAFEALKEGLYLRENRASVSEERIASYLDRVTKAACNFQQNVKLPQLASAALAESFKAGTGFTLDQITSAYNQNGGNPPAMVNSLIAAYNGILNDLNTAASGTADIPDAALLGIYASNGELSSLSTGSTYHADQALALLQVMASPNQRCQIPLNYVGVSAGLTGNAALTTTPAFSDVEVYHQRMQCPQGSLEARVKVYAPQGTTVSGVTISANGISSMSLTTDDFPSPGTSNWKLSGGPQPACVDFNQTYTFTITATLSSGTITTTVTRKILDVPEARITLIAKDYSETGVVFTQGNTGQPNSPIKLASALSSERPLFKWTPVPGEDSAAAISAPAGSQIKYLYDISHFAINPGGGGGPESRDFVNCPVVQSNNGKFFDKDYVLSPIDCDVNKCNAALPDVQHVCRIHVQTVLVDEFDRTLGWSAGADLYYCIEGQSNCP